MFVKLKKKDGSPVWVNAGYVVTVTPAKYGGSTVVPIGDGFDYDVMEEPDEVVALLSGAAGQEAEKPKRKTRSKKAAAQKTGGEPKGGGEGEPKGESAPKAESEPKDESAPEDEVESVFGEAKGAPAAEDVLAEKLKFDFPEEYIARLRKLAPRSLRKLNNTLVAQCNVTDPGPVVMYLVDRRVISIDKSHVTWLNDPSADPDNMADMVFG